MASVPSALRLSTLLPRQTSFARTSIQLQRGARGLQYRSAILSHRKATLPARPSPSGSTQKRWTSTPSQTPPGLSETAATKTSTTDPSAYTPPTTGLLSRLPPSWVPYAELIRLDKPAGTYYLFAPCLFSTLLAASHTSPTTPPLTVLSTTLLFFSGALIMRGAGCTINDLWDRNLDPHVARTRLRPIARGAITVRQAIPFLGLQLFTGLGILLQFPWSCFWYATPSLVLVTLYPLAKRITNYPQFVLGLTFSWGAIMGFPALGVDLLSNTPALVTAGCLYASCVAWTLIYDMIYAYQDIRDDAKAGIKSIALAQEKNAKAFLTAVAGVQTALLVGSGWAVGAGPIYYLLTCGGAAATLEYMIRVVKLESVQDCAEWFRRGVLVTGGAIAAGLGLEYLAEWVGLYDAFGLEGRVKAKSEVAEGAS